MCEGVHMNMGGKGCMCVWRGRCVCVWGGGGGDLGVHRSVHLKPCCNLQALRAPKA